MIKYIVFNLLFLFLIGNNCAISSTIEEAREARRNSNKESAISIYQDLASENDVDTQYELAEYYEELFLVGEDINSSMYYYDAIKWFKLVAEKGMTSSQVKLAILLKNTNKIEAYAWWLVIVDSDPNVDKWEMQMLEKKLNSEQIAKAHNLSGKIIDKINENKRSKVEIAKSIKISEAINNRKTIKGRLVRVSGLVTRVLDYKGRQYVFITDDSLENMYESGLVIITDKLVKKDDIIIVTGYFEADDNCGLGYIVKVVFYNPVVTNLKQLN